jgi:hypothetical protein
MALLEVGAGKPYLLIQNALTAAGNGDHVRVDAPAAGFDYPEDLTVVNNRITLAGVGATLLAPRIGIVGTGAGNPALKVSGTGGVFLRNFRFSNVGATAGIFIVELNVAEDWISGCLIDGDGNKDCLQAQFGDNCLLANGRNGVTPSCPGQNLFLHFTAVNHTLIGIKGNANLGEFVGGLAYNCAGGGFVNGLAQYCLNCASDDITCNGLPQSSPLMPLADIAFVNYALGDFRLLPTSAAYFPGMSQQALDFLGNRRVRDSGREPRVYAGAHDPWPTTPTYLTGGSSIRVL